MHCACTRVLLLYVENSLSVNACFQVVEEIRHFAVRTSVHSHTIDKSEIAWLEISRTSQQLKTQKLKALAST